MRDLIAKRFKRREERMDDRLSDRKKRVLKALVDSYISDPQPISSSAIQSKYMPEVSSATIRSELATLEELGYLVQPHVSSGRVPSSKAYRFYVDCMMDEDCGDVEIMQERFDKNFGSVEELVRNTAKVVSDATNYTSLMVFSGTEKVVVKEVKLVDLLDGNALVVIITDSGVLKDKMVGLPEGADGGYIEIAGKLLNSTFAGKNIAEIQHYEEPMERSFQAYRSLFRHVVEMIEEYRTSRESQLYLEGEDKIFEYPESRDVDNVRSFVSIISKKEKLHDLVKGDGNVEFDVKIGDEESEDLKNMALVTAKYTIDGKEVGHVGVIGPQRMDYKKVMSVLRRLGGALDDGGDNDNG